MRHRLTTALALVAMLSLVLAMPALASESGSYTTSSGTVVKWVFTGPTPDNPDGSWSWTETCPHCGTVINRGTNKPPEFDRQN